MLSVCFLPFSRAVLDCFHQNFSQPCWFHPPDVIAIMNDHNKWTCGDSNPGPTGYEPVALTNWATGPHMKADERTRTVNLLITNQLLCQLSHIGAFCFYMLHRSIGRAQASLVCSPLIDKVNKPELSHIGVFSFYIAFCVPLENFIFPLARWLQGDLNPCYRRERAVS